jgi:hypothetical protein
MTVRSLANDCRDPFAVRLVPGLFGFSPQFGSPCLHRGLTLGLEFCIHLLSQSRYQSLSRHINTRPNIDLAPNSKTATMSSHNRQSLAPTSLRNNSTHTSSHPSHTTTSHTSTSRLSTLPPLASKQRQLSHLNSQLAQLTAHMSDLENLLRMTAVQAEGMRGLGGYAGGMFMAASKVLGEEAVKGDGSEGR